MTDADDYRRIEQALAFLRTHRAARPSLAETAAEIGLGPHHFQRLFLRWAGTTPKRFLQYLTAEAARARLRDARSVLDATWACGLSSPGRLHDLLVTVSAVTPGEVRNGGAGLRIRTGVHDTPLGEAFLAVTDRGILALAFGETESAEAALCEDWPAADHVVDREETARWMRRIFEPAVGERRPLPLRLKGTNLQLRVWEALLQIPAGTVVSYGGLAAALGRPAAARAVAGAVAANRIGLLIPCHRVLRAGGDIGGYRWGVDRKQALLGREFARADRQADQARAASPSEATRPEFFLRQGP